MKVKCEIQDDGVAAADDDDSAPRDHSHTMSLNIRILGIPTSVTKESTQPLF